MKPKKESGRKILSFLLTFALIVSLVPAMTLTASAAETDDAVVIGQDENLIGQEETISGQDQNMTGPEDIIPGPDENTIEQEAVVPEPDENSIEQDKAVPEQEENEKEPKKVILDPDGAVLYREAAWNETDKKVEYTEKSVA